MSATPGTRSPSHDHEGPGASPQRRAFFSSQVRHRRRGEGASSPRARARPTASVRLCAPSFSYTCRVCVRCSPTGTARRRCRPRGGPDGRRTRTRGRVVLRSAWAEDDPARSQPGPPPLALLKNGVADTAGSSGDRLSLQAIGTSSSGLAESRRLPAGIGELALAVVKMPPSRFTPPCDGLSWADPGDT